MGAPRARSPEEIVKLMAASGRGRRKYGNQPTDCGQSHRHASKYEALQCDEIFAEAEQFGWRVFVQVRWPLGALVPTSNGRAELYTPDWSIWAEGKWLKVIEAKGSRSAESRDFKLRLSAFRATYPEIPVEIRVSA